MLMRWRMQHIGWFMLLGLAFVACTHSAKVPEPAVPEQGRRVEGPTPELSTIDSLMWHRPDSAFALLLDFASSPKADSLDVFNGHYCQVLISELLYKNDCEQTNREDLLKAVRYFDSLCVEKGGAMGRGDAINRVSTGGEVFLDARAHYINGVGYYELGNVVQACSEYLKTLELMESRFEDKTLMGHKARFMALTYGRLGEMFNEQLLAEPAITCYKQALLYCKREPTSIYGIPVLLYNLGIQYDVANQKDSAAFYYDKALANLPDYDNIHYRDIITSKSVLAFNLGFCVDSVIKDLKYVISLTSDDIERTYRFLNLGNILFESNQYDSSQLYLETVFEQKVDIQSRILAAENLSNIYQMEGDSLKAQNYASFLAGFTMSEIEKKKDVSKINEMFKNYLTQKQEKRAEEEQEKAIKRVIKIFIPIAVVIAMAILIFAKLRGKKLLQDKEKHHQREIESERQSHRMQQAALSGRLKKSNEELRDVSKQLEQSLSRNTSIGSDVSDNYASFVNVPVCLYIVELVHKQQFKSKMNYLIYKDYALSKDQILALRDAAEKHLTRFVSQIRKQFPKLTDSDMDYCYLFLLGLNEADISALMQRAYTTVCDRSRKINRIIEADDSLYHALRNMLNE